jgi:GNAT superfamily N-acetyltransferase
MTADEARSYAVDEVVRDGRPIHIRAIRPDDKQRLREHYDGLSEEARYYRFFGLKRGLSDADLARLTELDFTRDVGLAATMNEAGREKFIGVGRYVCVRARPALAEVAFAVLDRFQGLGIATLLLEHLSRIAIGRGVTEFEADVMAENKKMLDVFEQSGFEVRASTEAGVVTVVFPTAETERLREVRRSRRSGSASPTRTGRDDERG